MNIKRDYSIEFNYDTGEQTNMNHFHFYKGGETRNIEITTTVGYGVRIKGNLTPLGEERFTNRHDGEFWSFLKINLKNFKYGYIGDRYRGNMEPILILEDPIKNGNMDSYHKFISKLDKVRHLLKDVTPKWVCEICIS